MEIHQLKDQIKGIEGKNDKEIEEYLTDLYTYNGCAPRVAINGNEITIVINSSLLESADADVQKGNLLCQKQDYAGGIEHFLKALSICPAYADAWRSMAQAKMMMEMIDEAIADNEKALEYDATNPWALTLMGNLWVRKGDVEKGLEYYNKVIENNPNEALALSNIAGIYIKMHREKEAIPYFEKAIKANNTYLNSYYGLAVAQESLLNLQSAFDTALEGIQVGQDRPENPDALKALQSLLLKIAAKITNEGYFQVELEDEKKELEELGNLPILFTEVPDLNVYAQMRYAKARGWDHHEVVYNPNKGKALPHLFMHELMHLEMAIQASNIKKNAIVVTDNNQVNAFKKRYKANYEKWQDTIGYENADHMMDQLMKGILLQVMNCGLDMLVEKRIFDKFPVLRPVQLASMYSMLMEFADSVKQASADDRLPKEIVQANKIMNIASAVHFKSLYGIDIVEKFNPTPFERNQAKKIFDEYCLYRDQGYEPGDEYDFVYMIAQLFKYDDYLKFEDEPEDSESDFYQKLSHRIDSAIEKNPVVKDKMIIDEINSDFRKEHPGDPSENMMMTMYMLGALEYFVPMDTAEIYKIAMEIAVVGLNGINPNNKGYKVTSIPNKEFGGYEFLAYYYVSFALAAPQLLEKLGLPFADAYTAAKDLFDKRK